MTKLFLFPLQSEISSVEHLSINKAIVKFFGRHCIIASLYLFTNYGVKNDLFLGPRVILQFLEIVEFPSSSCVFLF